MTQRVASLLLASVIAASSAYGALIGVFWGFGLKCDDSCSSAPLWRDDPNAWQWDALGTVALAGFACGLIFLLALTLRWRLFSLVVLAAWATLAAAFLTLFRDSGLTSNAERGWAGLAALLLAGLAAIALTPRPER
ncbi:MAG TPA: hypothetical protein VFR32_05435 [Gaiellaceae bacterium]|nr:hypothetical protein [Gaiellaceae bacterium]